VPVRYHIFVDLCIRSGKNKYTESCLYKLNTITNFLQTYININLRMKIDV